METYRPSAHGLMKSGIGTNIGGQAHFTSSTHLMKPAPSTIQVSWNLENSLRCYQRQCISNMNLLLLQRGLSWFPWIAGHVCCWCHKEFHFSAFSLQRRIIWPQMWAFELLWVLHLSQTCSVKWVFASISWFLCLADNLTEALLFLSHFMGDIHQVRSIIWMSILFSLLPSLTRFYFFLVLSSHCMLGSRVMKVETPLTCAGLDTNPICTMWVTNYDFFCLLLDWNAYIFEKQMMIGHRPSSSCSDRNDLLLFDVLGLG